MNSETKELFLELIDLLAKRVQEGGQGLADSAESPLMKLRKKVEQAGRRKSGKQ